MQTVEVLLAAMHQNDMRLAAQCNIDADILIINQCDREDYCEEINNGRRIRMISTKERGLSNSRNMAIRNAKGDICVFCDDDVVYRGGAKEAILQAYAEKSDADIIAFNFQVYTKDNTARKKINNFGKALWYRTYSSVALTFRREAVLERELYFNPFFGTGSSKIACGEESLWQMEARKKGCIVYENPFCIAETTQENSTWFTGYDEKYFYDKGAYIALAMPKMAWLFKFYYIYRLRAEKEIRVLQKIKWLHAGTKGIKRNQSFAEYVEAMGKKSGVKK